MRDNTVTTKLLFLTNVIKDNSQFRMAINEYGSISIGVYKNKPLFYKKMLQETRLNIAKLVCCLIFSNKICSLSDLKITCTKYKIASPNSVTSIIGELYATGLITILRCKSDRRKTAITLTSRGIEELENYISCAFVPMKTLFPGVNIDLNFYSRDMRVKDFFNRVAESLFYGLKFNKRLLGLELFINKAAGRMIMLHLYLDAIKKPTKNTMEIDFSPRTLAMEYSVSRVHVIFIIKSAQDAGYLKIINNVSLVINSIFIELVEIYMAHYFAYIAHCIDAAPNELITAVNVKPAF